jgi:hypothetical protein
MVSYEVNVVVKRQLCQGTLTDYGNRTVLESM